MRQALGGWKPLGQPAGSRRSECAAIARDRGAASLTANHYPLTTHHCLGTLTELIFFVRFRPLLFFTALMSSILGGVAVYRALTVPNDVQAGALMKQARADMQRGDEEEARQSLARVLQQYPRTDAAAAATVALSTLEASDRQRLARQVEVLQRTVSTQTLRLEGVLPRLNAPPTPPPTPPRSTPAPPPPRTRRWPVR